MWFWIMFLNLRQDVRNSYGLGIHSTLSSHVQGHVPVAY